MRGVNPCLYALVFMLSSSAAFATGQISGLVVDKISQKQVIGAVVTLEVNASAAHTIPSSSFGLFEITDVVAATYTLRVVHPAYEPYSESVQMDDNGRLSKKIDLVRKAGVLSVFDVSVQVFDVKSQQELRDASVTVEYWKAQPGSPSATADATETVKTDADGAVTLRGRQAGWYRFTAVKEGWEALSSPKKDELPAELTTGHNVTAQLKPIPHTLTVTVTGFDPVLNTDNLALRGITCELEGLAWDDDKVVIAPVTEMTDSSGQITFKNLPPIRWRATCKKFGYAHQQRLIGASTANHASQEYDGVALTMSLTPTEFKVEIESPYKNPDVMLGVVVQLKGVLNSASQGIDRELTVVKAPDGEIHAIFQNIMPGKYQLHVKSHEKALENLPPCGTRDVCGPTSLLLKFRAQSINVEIDNAKPQFTLLTLLPMMATIRGRIVAHEGFVAGKEFLWSGNTTNAKLAWRQARLLVAKAATEITFEEHHTAGRLRDPYKITKVDSDADGNFVVTLYPGRYGIRIPTLEGYEGYSVVWNGTEVGWPYQMGLDAVVEKDPDKHGSWIHAEGGTENALTLNVNKHFANISYALKPSEADPYQQVVPFVTPNFGLEGLTTTPWQDLLFGATCKLTGTTTTGTSVDNAVAPIKDVESGQLLCQFANLMPGTYTASATHPRYDFTSTSHNVKISAFTKPGELPNFQDWHTTAGTHVKLSPPLAAPYTGTSGTISFKTFKCNGADSWVEGDPGVSAVLVEPSSGALPSQVQGKLYSLGGSNPKPFGPFKLTVTFGERVNPPTDGSLKWVTWSADGSAAGNLVFIAYTDDANTPCNTSKPAACSDANTFCSGSISKDNKPGTDAKFTVTVKTISQSGLVVNGIKIEPDPNDFYGIVPFNSGTTVEFPQSCSQNPTGPKDCGAINFNEFDVHTDESNWKLANGTSPTAKVIGYAAGTGFQIEVTMVVERSMTVSGIVTLPDSSPARDTRVIITNRLGSWLGVVKTDDQGQYTSGKLDPQELIVEVHRRGYKPGFLCPQIGDKKNPSVTGANIQLAPLDPPTLALFTLDRHGIFLPAVRKSGGQTLTTNPHQSDNLLTATFAVKGTATPFTYQRPKYEDAQCPASSKDTISVKDWVTTVLFVDRRVFDVPGLTDKDAKPLTERLQLPTNFDQYLELLQNLRKGERDGKPFHVVWRRSDTSEADGSFQGKLQLWDLPAGKMEPMAIIVTMAGAVLALDYLEPPNKPVLNGLRLPQWAAFLTDLVGTLAAASQDLKLEEVMLPKGNIIPIPAGIVATITNDPHGFVNYKYALDVQWNEGQQAPRAGLFGLGPGWLGVKLKAGLTFSVEGDKDKTIALTASGELTKNFLAALGLDKPVSLPSNQRVTVDKMEITGSAALTVAEMLSGEPGVPAGYVPSYKMQTSYEVFYEMAVRYDATPLLSLLAKMIPHVGPPMSVALKAAKARKLLEFYGLLGGGFGVGIKKNWFTLYPQGTGSVTLSPFAQQHFLGGTGVAYDPLPDEFSIQFKFYTGLSADAFRGKLRGDLTLQLGAEKGSSNKGVKVYVNKETSWPPITMVEGAASIVAKLTGQIGVVKGSRSWQFDLPFKKQLGTEGLITLSPSGETTSLLTPFSATPSTFTGGSTLIENFYGAGQISVSKHSSSPVVAYTQTDPTTGKTTLQVSVWGVGGWSTPLSLGESGGVLSVATVEMADGRKLVAWSQIDAAEMFSTTPKTTIMYSVSDANGENWSAAKAVISSNETMHGLQLVATSKGALLAFMQSPNGERDSDQSVKVGAYDGEWGSFGDALPRGPLTGVLLVGDLSSESAVVIGYGEGVVLAVDTNNGQVGSPSTVATLNANSVAATYLGGDLYVVIADKDGNLDLYKRPAGGGWGKVATLAAEQDLGSLAMATTKVGGGDELVVAWITRGADNDVMMARYGLDGSPIKGPTSVAGDGTHTYREISLVVDGSSAVRLFLVDETSSVSSTVHDATLDLTTMSAPTTPGDTITPGADASTADNGKPTEKLGGGGCQQSPSSNDSVPWMVMLALLALITRRGKAASPHVFSVR